MKTVKILFSALILFSFCNLPVNAQLDSFIVLEGDQADKGKEIQAQYLEEKEDLELQLKKLVKDREVARRDKNTSLEQKRTREIEQTRKHLKNLSSKYGKQFNEILTDEQKEQINPDADFYAKELAAEQKKMEEAEAKKTVKKKAPSKKAPAKKKTTNKK